MIRFYNSQAAAAADDGATGLILAMEETPRLTYTVRRVQDKSELYYGGYRVARRDNPSYSYTVQLRNHLSVADYRGLEDMVATQAVVFMRASHMIHDDVPDADRVYPYRSTDIVRLQLEIFSGSPNPNRLAGGGMSGSMRGSS